MLETARTWGVSGTSGISASSPHSISRSSDAPTGRSRRTRRPRTDGHRADGHRVAGHRVAGHRVAGHRVDGSPGVRMAAASSTWVSPAPRRRYSARTRAHTARKRRSPLESTPLRLSSATLPAWNPHTCGQHWQPCQREFRAPVDTAPCQNSPQIRASSANAARSPKKNIGQRRDQPAGTTSTWPGTSPDCVSPLSSRICAMRARGSAPGSIAAAIPHSVSPGCTVTATVAGPST